jgi:hypothetical protein
MSNIILGGGPSGGGSVTLLAPNTNSNQIASIPDRTGNVSMDGPAFSAVKLTNQNISNATFTKIAFTGETFDTANAFDSVTNYRFQPQVAGYYQLNALGQFDGSSVTRTLLSFYKNGSQYYIGADFNSPIAPRIGTSCIMYLNGSTDYAEMYGYITASSGNIIYASTSVNQIDATAFQGCLVRAA